MGKSRMPSLDDHRSHRLVSSLPGADEPAPSSGPLAAEEKVTATLPSALIPLPGQPVLQTSQLMPVVTRKLPAQNDGGVTRILSATRVSENTSQRLPIVIKSDLKKRSMPAPLPRRKRTLRRLLVNVIGVLLLSLVTVLTLLSVTPLGHEIGVTFNPLQFGS